VSAQKDSSESDVVAYGVNTVMTLVVANTEKVADWTDCVRASESFSVWCLFLEIFKQLTDLSRYEHTQICLLI